MKKYREKGITIIVPVITIVVLIIIAGISITFLMGDNVILNKSKLARQNYDSAQAEENSKL